MGGRIAAHGFMAARKNRGRRTRRPFVEWKGRYPGITRPCSGAMTILQRIPPFHDASKQWSQRTTQKISIASLFRGNNDRSIGYPPASLHGLRDPTGPASSGAGFFDPLG